MRLVLATGCLVAATAILAMPVGEVTAEPAPAPLDQASLVARVLELTNVERGKLGLAPLQVSVELQSAAQAYSQVLASGDCFEHTCGPLPKLADRDSAAGYLGWTWLGENIAGGYATPEAVMAGWMASSAHRANVLKAEFTETGIGVTGGGGRFGVYWAQEFGTRDDAADDDD
jgi:uncharacterized protein YkwD